MKIASLLNENQQTNTGTVKGLPVDKDLIYKARNNILVMIANRHYHCT